MHALVKMADYDTSSFTEPLKVLTDARSDYVDIMPIGKDGLWDHVLKLERRPPRPMAVWACGERVGPVWKEAVERGLVGGEASFDPEEDGRIVARCLSIRRIRRALGEVGCKALYGANWSGHIVEEWFEFRRRLYVAERGGYWKECVDVLHDAAEWAAGDREGRALPVEAHVDFLRGLLEAERLEHARLDAEQARLRRALGTGHVGRS